jgi:hypothetical protein
MTGVVCRFLMARREGMLSEITGPMTIVVYN